jgi:hypothetical protein
MQTVGVSSRIDALLSHVTDTPKAAAALLDALAHHVESKTRVLSREAHEFESKWKMSFDEFASRVKTGRPGKVASAYDAQQDLKAWEQTLAMLKHYRSLKVR